MQKAIFLRAKRILWCLNFAQKPARIILDPGIGAKNYSFFWYLARQTCTIIRI